MLVPRKTPERLEELRPVQEKRFQHQMDLVFKAHPYYKEIFRQKGILRRKSRSTPKNFSQRRARSVWWIGWMTAR